MYKGVKLKAKPLHRYPQTRLYTFLFYFFLEPRNSIAPIRREQEQLNNHDDDGNDNDGKQSGLVLEWHLYCCQDAKCNVRKLIHEMWR